mmetsp:Transcript_72637/g.109571  ORF Transcript_72637/g.109571 Transcript_72637/m.109571 type:complete len:93 (-) Transcript_72637:291-569(-)
MDGLPVPAFVLKEAELIQHLLRWVLMPAIASIDERCAWKPSLARVLSDCLLQPSAHTLDLRPYDEKALANGVAAEHLYCVRDGLILCKGGSL